MTPATLPPNTRRREWALATLSGAVIAVLGGLIGLGAAEFRLPVLVGLFGLAARRAVPLNAENRPRLPVIAHRNLTAPFAQIGRSTSAGVAFDAAAHRG